MSAPAADEVEVPQTDWAEKMLTSIPANQNTSRNQQAMVAEDTDLLGLTKETNKLLTLCG